MDKITVSKHGFALLMLMLMVGNMPLGGWAKTLYAGAGKAPQQRKGGPPAKVPIPADWITIEDEEVGYSFEVPKGATHTLDKKDDIVTIHVVPPAPIAVGVLVFAYRGKRYTKENLLKMAMGTVRSPGTKTLTTGELVEAGKEYSVADYTVVDTDGAFRGKTLVATGVNDSYVMLVFTAEGAFKANEELMDELWGRFSILPVGAYISDLTLGKDKAMRQPSEEFTTTETIFAAVPISKNDGTVNVIGKLHVVAIAGQKPGPIPGIEATVTIKGEGTANFQFSKPTKGWPLGKYKFEALLINEKGETIDSASHEFSVN